MTRLVLMMTLVLFTVSVVRGASPQDTVAAAQSLADVKADRDKLCSIVLPPEGTPRSDIEVVYGIASYLVEKGHPFKGPTPHYQYTLHWRNESTRVFLCVQYDDAGKAKWVYLANCGFPAGLDREPSSEQLLQWYKDEITTLYIIRDRFAKTLEKATWHLK